MTTDVQPAVTRTAEEIIARIERIQRGGTIADFLGFRQEVLIGALDYEHAKAYLKPEVTADDWPDEDQRESAMDYLAFAWGKAADHRGISAGRSIQKLGEWAWLLGREDVAERMENAPHQNYGAPALKVFAEAFEQPIPEDEGLRNMMEGRPCFPDCEDGCGR